MKIGIDISQITYEATGVANFTRQLVEHLVRLDKKNEYILFGSSLRRRTQLKEFQKKLSRFPHVKVKIFPFPPSMLDILWNRFHVIPIEVFIGKMDVFISSDWTQPPTKAKKVTVLYDLIVYKYPKETHDQLRFDAKSFRVIANIVSSQKRRLRWVKKEIDIAICISKATKKDAMEILGMPEEKLKVIYPGF